MYKLAETKDIPPGQRKIVLLPDGREVALFNVDGKFHAIENVCPHMGGPLGWWELDDCVLTCPWHGWQFDVKNGACINMPGEDASVIPIEVRDGNIFLRE